MTTGYAYHEIVGWHDTSSAAGIFPSDPGAGLQPFVHLENAETKRRLHELVVVSGSSTTWCASRRGRQRTTRSSASTRRSTWRASRPRASCPRAATPATASRRSVAAGCPSPAAPRAPSSSASTPCSTAASTNAYTLVRPPGHHAIAASGMGFCIFGNLAIAAAHARAVRGVERIAVVDWDVHHGNGTQSAFYAEPDVLTISIHQDNVFPPDSGALTERR